MPVTSSLPVFIRVNRHLALLNEVLQYGASARERLAGRDDPMDREVYLSRIAKTVHDGYSLIERILEDLAKDIDGGKPSGHQWHADLLAQMEGESPLRPAVISPEISPLVNDLLSFRHFWRNAYNAPLRETEILGKLDALSTVVLPAFVERLELLARCLEEDPDEPSV